MKFFRNLIVNLWFIYFMSVHTSAWASVVLSSQDQKVIIKIGLLRSSLENFKQHFKDEFAFLGYRGNLNVTRKLSSLVVRLDRLESEPTLVGPRSKEIHSLVERVAKVDRNSANWLKLSQEAFDLDDARCLLDQSTFIAEQMKTFIDAQAKLFHIGAECSELMNLTRDSVGAAYNDLRQRYVSEPSTVVEENLEEIEKQILFSATVSLLAIEFELLNKKMLSFFERCKKEQPPCPVLSEQI